MSSLQVVGALAQGYTEAAKQRREQNLALGEHQRDLQLNLLDKLLADPSTPEEYKGAILQHRIATTNANQYDKNGILKLPSLDDMRQSLPPVQRPQPNPVQAPAIAMPSAPPTGSAAMPPSGVQKPAGSSPVPLQFPTPPQGPPSASAIGANGPSLPATPIALPTPPPIAEAGQFHPLTQSEQQQRAIDLARKHADSLIAQGVPREQALVAAGLAPKPEFVHQPFMGKTFNAYTGQEVGESANSKPIGTPQTFVVDGKQVTMQHFIHNDGSDSWAPIVAPGGSEATKPIVGTLPTQRSTSSSYNAETGTTSTTSTTQKILPGVTPKAVRNTFDRPASPTSFQADSGKSNVAKMAEQWANFGVVPNAKDKRQVSAYMNDHQLQPMVKLPTSEGRALSTVFTDLQDAKNRLSTMQEDVKQIESGAANAGSYDMDLLSQHIALTFGTVKGVRTSQQLIEHHLKARSLPENLVVMYGKLKDGQQLSPEQRANFIHLAETRSGLAQKKYDGLRGELESRYGQNALGLKSPSAPPSSGPKTPEDEANEYLNSIKK